MTGFGALTITVELERQASRLIADIVADTVALEEDVIADAVHDLFEVLNGQLLDASTVDGAGTGQLLVARLKPYAELALRDTLAILRGRGTATHKAKRILHLAGLLG